MSPWDLVKERRFAEAVDAYTAELSDGASPFNLHNRGTAYLNLGEFDLALEDFTAADRLNSDRSDAHRQRIGVVHWLAGREDMAIAVWEELVHALRANQIAYTDAAGGVAPACLLWFAGVRRSDGSLRETAVKSLRNALKSRRPLPWPGPIGQLLLGRDNPSNVLCVVSKVPVLRERQQCQAEFYCAALSLQQSRTSDWIAGLRRSSMLWEAIHENEFYLSRFELSRCQLDPENA